MNALVLGGTGMLGYSVCESLTNNNWKVRVFSNTDIPEDVHISKVEYVFGDINNKEELNKAMEDIDVVFYFISTSFPKECSLEKEINVTCNLLEKVIQSMKESGVKKIVYPSSGGTVYGSLATGKAKEEDALNPSNPYGVGKVLNEQMLRFYAKQGMDVLVLRIGNVYGSSLMRIKPQGVIDLFVQNILSDKEINIWGDVEGNERDYIFIDDLADACELLARQFSGFEIYNVASGVGTSLKEIVELLKDEFKDRVNLKIDNKEIEGNVSRIVLDVSKLHSTGFTPKYDLKNGILETIKRKTKLVK